MFCVLAAVAFLAACSTVESCSPENFPDSVPFVKKMYHAPVVVSGRTTYIDSNNTHDATVRLDCIYKHGNTSINVFGADIKIDGRYCIVMHMYVYTVEH